MEAKFRKLGRIPTLPTVVKLPLEEPELSRGCVGKERNVSAAPSDGNASQRLAARERGGKMEDRPSGGGKSSSLLRTAAATRCTLELSKLPRRTASRASSRSCHASSANFIARREKTLKNRYYSGTEDDTAPATPRPVCRMDIGKHRGNRDFFSRFNL